MTPRIMTLVVGLLFSSFLSAVRAQPPGPVPAEARLPAGQTLEDLAEKYFDDPAAAESYDLSIPAARHCMQGPT